MTRAGSILQNNRRSRKSQNQPSNVSEFFKSIILAFLFVEIAKNP